MDVTSEYVKQCEKAVEIQNKSPRKDFMDLEFSSGVYFSPDGNRWFRKINGSRVHIWLPRQDDLQGMVKKPLGNLIKIFSAWAEIYAESFTNNSKINGNTIELDVSFTVGFPSMEQLWLAFVMKEKYGKVWNGEEWVR